MKKMFKGLVLLIMLLALSACQKESSSAPKESEATTSLRETKNLDFRLAFNKIKITQNQTDFSGGSSLAELKSLFGEPQKTEQKPAGDVTLDVYTWTKDDSTVVVQLFKDSAIARSISQFSFNREAKIGLKDFNQLKEGISYTKAKELLGEPDLLSQAISSDRYDTQAVWTSGLKSQSTSPTIELKFENDKLTSKQQKGLS